MIKSWIDDLLKLTEADWEQVAFSHELLAGLVLPADRAEFRRKTAESAENLAGRLLRGHPGQNPAAIAGALGVKFRELRGAPVQGTPLFAWFEEPDTILVYPEFAAAADRLLQENDLWERFGSVKTADLLTAHELYHYLELHEPDIYSAQPHLTLWRLGPYRHRSRLAALGEVGAMSFARALTGLQCSPYIYNILMIYPFDQQKAGQLCHSYLNLGPAGRRAECTLPY